MELVNDTDVLVNIFIAVGLAWLGVALLLILGSMLGRK